MNEIEKMYENAGIEQIEGQEWVCKNPYHCTYQNLSIVPENCSRCKSFQIEMIYPPFTAEKQIKLIKWLAKKDCMYRLTYERDFLWCSQLEWQSSFCYESRKSNERV